MSTQGVKAGGKSQNLTNVVCEQPLNRLGYDTKSRYASRVVEYHKKSLQHSTSIFMSLYLMKAQGDCKKPAQ